MPETNGSMMNSIAYFVPAAASLMPPLMMTAVVCLRISA